MTHCLCRPLSCAFGSGGGIAYCICRCRRRARNPTAPPVLVFASGRVTGECRNGLATKEKLEQCGARVLCQRITQQCLRHRCK